MMILIYDRFTRQKLLITEEGLIQDYKQFHDWYVYESMTGNSKVSEWVKAKEDAEESNGLERI